MTQNLGLIDRIIRMIIAILSTVLFLSGNFIGRPIGMIFFLVAAIMAFTSVVGFCPTYLPFNVSTRKG